MNRDAFKFRKIESETLEQKAARAVDTIYLAGLSFRGGHLSSGGNCVMAGYAAKAFDAAELTALRQSGDARQALMADVLETYSAYDDLDYRTEGKACAVLLQKTYDLVQDLKKAGFQTSGEPHRTGYSTPAPRP